MNDHDIWKFNLQLFADDPEPDTGSDEGAEAPEGKPPEDKLEKPEQGKKRYTDEDVDDIINRKFAEWQKKQQKAVNEAKKLAEMNAQQKAEYERDQLQKELDDYKRKDSLAEMTKTARKMLSESGITASDDILSVLVTTDAEQTKAAIDSFSKTFQAAVEAAVKERLRGEPPRRGSGGGAAPMTKEQIMKIRDPELRQKKMLENKELFNF